MAFALSLIIIGCWIIFLVYWAINATKTKPSQEVKKGTWIYKSTILYSAIAIALASRWFILFGCATKLSTCRYDLSIPSVSTPLSIEYLSVILMILGLTIAILARKKLADNWSSVVDYKTGHKLIITGVYKYMRHPIYSGFFLMGLGTVLFVNVSYFWIIFIVALILFVIRIKKEEQLMIKHFPKEYPEYKKKVKALIPFIF